MTFDTNPIPTTVDPDDGEILRGAKAIARFLGPDWTPRQVEYHANKGTLPITKFGKQLIATRRALLAKIEEAA